MIIVLDFDDVLFDTFSFKKELAVIFQKHKLDFWEIYNKIKYDRDIFSLEKSFNLAQKENNNVDIKKLTKSIDKLFKNLNQFLYSDTYTFLQSFQRHNLIILSWGNTEFQKRKIYGLGKEFTSFFDEIIAGPIEKFKILDKIIQLYKDRPIVFIDDKIKELKKVRENFKNVILIRLKRKTNQVSAKNNYEETTNLAEVKRIIESGATTTNSSKISDQKYRAIKT